MSTQATLEATPRPNDCQCKSEIADLQARLETIERLLDFNSPEQGLAAEIMRRLKGSDVRSLIVDHITREVSEVGSYSGAGVVPPELEAIGRKNSAALEEMMKKIDS